MGFESFRNRMIPPQKCAEELSVSEFTVHRWIREKKILAVKLSSRCTRVVGDSLADFLERGLQSHGRYQQSNATALGSRQLSVREA